MIRKKQVNSLFCILWQVMVIVLAQFCVSSAIAYELRQTDQVINPIGSITYLEDPTGKLSFEQVSQGSISTQFKPGEASGAYLNFGFTSSAIWLKIPLRRAADAHANWILKISYLNLDNIDFYAPGLPVVRTGNLMPIDSRPVFDPLFLFPITLTENEQDFYIRVRSNAALSVPIDIFQPNALMKSVQSESLTQAIYYGGLLALALYNFLMFLSLRDKSFLLYTLFALTISLGMFAGNGFARLYLWPSLSHWDQISMLTIFTLGGALNFLFSRSFLKTKERAPKTDLLLRLVTALYFIVFILFLLSLVLPISKAWLIQFVLVLALFSTVILLFSTIQTIRAGHKDAYYFLLALSCLWIGACVASLRAFDILPSNSYTAYSLQIGSAFEMLLFSFALANRIHYEQNLRESVQRELSEARFVLLESLKESESRLERTVSQRTSELEKLLRNEKNLREQYDRFGAMISHEFRNPLGIIESQTALVKREDAAGINNIEKRINLISSATHRLALLFDKWLQSDRLNYAINSVKAARIDLPEWMADVTQKCRAYHPGHLLELRLSPHAPYVWADEQLLQIVVLNLVDNACKYSESESQVTIETRHKVGFTGIAVIDQGVGIAAEFHEKIFVEYFRINPENVVKGMGLGLPFVKRIMTLHGGEIQLESHSGQGSSFCVWFPDR